MPLSKFTVFIAGLVALIFVGAMPASAAATQIGLGTATSFAVLAGSGITNGGSTTITGDVGTFPTPAESGFGSVTLNGTNHTGDTVTQQAKVDFTTAYNQAAASNPSTSVATELGGLVFTPGVYSNATLGITGNVTLDALGDPNAVFIFKSSSTLITAAASTVTLQNGANACNIFWQVGTSATLGASSSLIGTVLASTSVSAGTGAAVQGRLLAGTGAVTLQTNVITNPGCTVTAPVTTTTTAPAPVSTTTTTATTAPGANGNGSVGSTGGNSTTTGTSTTNGPSTGLGTSANGTSANGTSTNGATSSKTKSGTASGTLAFSGGAESPTLAAGASAILLGTVLIAVGRTYRRHWARANGAHFTKP